MSAMEDDDEEQAGGTGRYPVMPSLVALQQMKNRLHLARLGKKLMKWTALATGRDLRKIAEELMVTYESFKEDVGNAFIVLARARYYCPSANKMVIENFAKTASVYVKTSTKSSSGVKTLVLEILEMDTTPYEHLGIGKGGIAIKEAKQAWLDLLRRMMLMLQHRTSFVEIECAHKNATKKKNVLEKVIVPRIVHTIRYILSELEEKEREETFRLKRFKQLKLKQTAIKEAAKSKRGKNIEVCKPSVPEMEYEEPKQVAPEPEPEPAPEVPEFKEEEPFYKPCGKPCIMAPKPIPVPVPEPIEPIEVCCSCLSVYDVDENAPEPLCPVCKKAARVRSKLSKSRLDLKPCESTQNKKRLEDLTTHIDEVINLTKRYKMEGIISPSIEKFIQTCNNTKEKIEDYANIASTCASHQNPPHMSRPASATGSQRSVRSNVPDRPTEVPTCREPTCGIRATTSKQVSAAGSQKSVRSDAPDKPPEVPGSKAPLSSASEPAIDPEELGYFESKYKEVIKVTRLQNEDGTITEERQVITVKTESKNLRKPDALERTYGDEKFVGSCTCHNYNIRHISKNNVHTTESYNSECIGHRGDEGLKDKPSGIKCARETTSEHTPRCPAMVEPKLRACISAGPERSMGGDVCKTCISIVSSKEIPLRTDSDSKKSVQCSKVSVATSTDSGICCLRKTPSVCSQKLRPHTSKASIGPEKKTDTAQKKVTLDKSTYCMPNCCDGKYNTISCGAMWRDACTSTTDIKISDSCTSKTSAGNNRKKSKKNKYKSNSRCKIKIIIKPPSGNDDKTKCKDDAFSVTNSVIDVLNKIIPCNQGNEGKPKRSAIEELCIKCLEKLKDKPSSCTVCREPPEDALEMAGPCHNCLVKMNDKTNSEKCINCQKKLEKALRTNDLCERCVAGLSSALGQDPSDKICSSCKACKEKIEALAKDSLCGSCLAKLSAKSPCRTPTKLTPKPSEVKSVEEVEKEIDCPLLAASSVPSNYCTSVATDTRTCSCNNTPSRNYVAVPTKYSRRCLRRLMNDGSKVSMRSACCGPCSEQRDAATVTKRSNRFDVRPIRRRHTCDFSEPRSRARQPKKSHSFHEKDYNYFKKPRQ